MKKILIMAMLSIAIHGSAQVTPKYGVMLESQLMKVSTSLNINRVGLNVTAGVDYKITNKMYLGAYFLRMTDISKQESAYYLINEKVVDLSTSSLDNIGIYAGYKLFSEENFSLIPEVRLGNLIYHVNWVSYGRNDISTFNVNMFSFTPRCLADYKITKYLSTGLSAGYLIPFSFNDESMKNYDVNNINMGMYLKLHL